MPNYFDIPRIPRLSPPPAVRPPDWGSGINLQFDPGTFDAARRLQAGISYRPDETDQKTGEIPKPETQNPTPEAPLERVRGDSPRAQTKTEEEKLRSRADQLGLAGVFGNAGDTIARGFMTLGGVKQGVPTGNERNLQNVAGAREETLGQAERARTEAKDQIPPEILRALSQTTKTPLPSTFSQLGKMSPLLLGIAHMESEKLRQQEGQNFQMGQQERSQNFQAGQSSQTQAAEDARQAKSIEAQAARQQESISAAGERASAAATKSESDKAEATKKGFIEKNSELSISQPEIARHREAISQIGNAMSELGGKTITPAQFQKAATLIATASQAGGTRSQAMTDALKKQPGLLENLTAWASQTFKNEPSTQQVESLRAAAQALEKGTRESQSRLIEQMVIQRYQAAKDLGIPIGINDIHRHFTGE